MHLHLLPEHPLDHHGAGWVRAARHFLGNLLNPWSAFLCSTLKQENQTHRDIRSICSQWVVIEGHRRFLGDVAPAESPLEVKSLLGLLPHCGLALGLIFYIVDFQIKVPSYIDTGSLSFFFLLSSMMSFLFFTGVKSFSVYMGLQAWAWGLKGRVLKKQPCGVPELRLRDMEMQGLSLTLWLDWECLTFVSLDTSLSGRTGLKANIHKKNLHTACLLLHVGELGGLQQKTLGKM